MTPTGRIPHTAPGRAPWIALGVVLGLAGGGFLACRPAVRSTLLPGCGKDTDCKGTRICVRGMCLEPGDGGAAERAGTPERPGDTASAPGAATSGGTVLPAPAITLEGSSPLFQVDWRHSGASRARLPATRPSEAARLATGSRIFSSPAIDAQGNAYLGAHDRKVRSLTRDGQERWSFLTEDLVWCSPALGPGGALYVGSDDDHLYALDAAQGRLRWSFIAGPCRQNVGVGPEATRCDVDGVTIGPDGTIYFVADGVYGLHPDGSLAFRFALPTHCAGAPAVGPDGTIYAGCQDGAIYALSPDGQKRWEYRTGDDVDSTPTVAEDGTIYVGSDDTKLYALAPTGELKWALKTEGPIRGSAALGPGGILYIGSYDGRLYAVRPSGEVAWTFRAADRIHGSPVVDRDGTVLVGAQDDRLYAIGADGRLRWSLLLGGDVDATPALADDGTIYIGDDSGTLRILR